MTLRDQIRSDPGRICCRVIAWDQALWWEQENFKLKGAIKKGRVRLLRRRPVGRRQIQTDNLVPRSHSSGYEINRQIQTDTLFT